MANTTNLRIVNAISEAIQTAVTAIMAERGLPTSVWWRFRPLDAKDPATPAAGGTIDPAHSAEEVRSIIGAYAAELAGAQTRDDDGAKVWLSGCLDDLHIRLYGQIPEHERTLWTTQSGARVELNEQPDHDLPYTWTCSGCGEELAYPHRDQAADDAEEHAERCA